MFFLAIWCYLSCLGAVWGSAILVSDAIVCRYVFGNVVFRNYGPWKFGTILGKNEEFFFILAQFLIYTHMTSVTFAKLTIIFSLFLGPWAD